MSATSNTISLNTNNFTIEFLLNLSVNQSSNIIYYLPNNSGFIIKVVSNIIYCYLNNVLIISGSVILQPLQWYHIAIVRNNINDNISNLSSTFYIFINGTLDDSVSTSVVSLNTSNFVITNSTVIYQIGNFIGFIDDIRVTNNISRYLSNFIPPVLPFSNGTTIDYLTIPNDNYYSYVVLLLHFNNVILDTSNYSNIITVGGINPNSGYSNICKYSGVKPFNFNGTTILTTPVSKTIVFGKDNFTFEFWMYYTSTQPGVSRIFGNLTSNSIGIYNWYIGFSNNVISLYVNSIAIFKGSITINSNTWYHIAIVRYGTTINGIFTSSFYLYVNGTIDIISQSTVSLDGADLVSNPNSQYLSIGGDGAGLSGSGYYNGLLSEIRITKHIPRYLNNFTVPQSIFANIDSIYTATSLNYYYGAQIIVSNWVYRISLSGGTINTIQVQNHINFVATLLTQNIWIKILRLNTFSGDQLQGALVPLKVTPGFGLSLDISSSTQPTYNSSGPSSGFTGNGTSTYIDTTLNLNTISSTGRDLHMGFFQYTSVASGIPMGVYNTSASRSYIGGGAGTGFYWGNSLTVPATSGGLYLSSNDILSTSTVNYYVNGAQQFITGTQNYSQPSDWSVYILAANGSATGVATETQVISNYSSARIGLYTIGNHLTGIDQLNYYNAIRQLNSSYIKA